MREPLAALVMRESGVAAPLVSHVHVRMNGAFFGLFAFVEQIDDVFLQRNGLPRGDEGGVLFKSTHGELSNLRWDVEEANLQFAYKKGNRKNYPDWGLLKAFTRGINGGGPGTRTEFLLDAVNVPAVINEVRRGEQRQAKHRPNTGQTHRYRRNPYAPPASRPPWIRRWRFRR